MKKKKDQISENQKKIQIQANPVIRPPRLEGKVKNAKMNPVKKKKKPRQ